ncbi:trypsin-like serine peptidase [Streptomyces sp. SS]|uniref:trypsin-like serine peptidase n=1 Tax=Streptomyces sp. SS TaxID=260742 RepID=UPI0002EF6AD0|nr:trypsin-like peptidase domain-containing protein [Streptomyces sp. SS]
MSDNGSKISMLGPTGKDANGKDFVDADGRRWQCLGKMVPRDFSVVDDEAGGRDAAYRPEPGPEARTLAVEALAEKLQPRRLVGEYEYRLAEPDYEVAERVLAMSDGVPTTEGYKTAESRYLIGGDDRVRLNPTNGWPASANAYLAPQGCSATMIGPSTAVCAAHCFYDNGWITSNSITFGANTDAPTAPFGSFLADSLTLPGAWNHNEWDWDFAVLEFSPSRPDLGRQTGWFGTAQNFDGTHTLVGYPSDKPTPTSWIRSGSFTAAPGSRYEHNLDIIPGDSGAGAYRTTDERVAGIQSTQWFTTLPPRRWNEVRRWDATTYNFFHAYGNWPRA